MKTTLSLPGWIRPTVVLGALAALGLMASACNEQSFAALSPDFAITWAEEFGYDATDLGQSTLSFGTVTTGDFSTIQVTLSNPGTAVLEFCDMYLAIVTFTEDGAVDSHLVVETDQELALLVDEELDLTHLAAGAAYAVGLQFTPLFGTPLAGTPLAENMHLVVKQELNWDCEAGMPSLTRCAQ